MSTLATMLGTGGRSLSYFLGALVVALTLAAGLSSLGLEEIAAWGLRALSATFLVIYCLLVFATIFCWTRLIELQGQHRHCRFWLESGLHAANGVATLGLTYTLLGISLGIGSLAQRGVTPETVEVVIQELTRHFSLAFLTTVIGLPTSALLRAFLLITQARVEASEGCLLLPAQGEAR